MRLPRSRRPARPSWCSIFATTAAASSTSRVHLASLIGGTRTNGQVMLNYVHNDKVGPTSTRRRASRTQSNALGLQRLVVITTRGTASASELVINSLRPFIPVTIVGDTTYGKPVGQYGLRFCDKVLYPVAFSIKNANFEGDYFDGLPVDCAGGGRCHASTGRYRGSVVGRSADRHSHRCVQRRARPTQVARAAAAPQSMPRPDRLGRRSINAQ